MQAVAVEGLHKRYGAIHALRGIDLEVDEGEVVALLGPNGAGKTTTIEILEGFVSPTAGSVRVLGFDPTHRSPDFLGQLGMVLQDCQPDPFLTVREAVELYAGYYPKPRSVADVLETVGLTHKSSARTRVLSGGERRRLDLAIALVGNPRLLFLDEPTTGFDPEARHAAWESIAGLHDAFGVTIMLTTHYLEEAEALADRIVVIDEGRIVAEGTAHELKELVDAATTVAFRALTGVDPDELPVAVDSSGSHWVIETSDPTTTLHALTGWATRRGVALEHLHVAPPSLESVYLEITR